ncbi:phosphoribosylanthranilate isomerase [Rossellomorea aquimaris]|uniref:phosphoribosylanthranilate isomerase n=1 Tax=Rossellomorea aquimaris TaxID=189382 RepID=UPI0007D05C79|nr:phosphoribosylanthranilate isomerase [Rossellomorea aquimaris]
MTKIKICGIQRIEEAKWAIEAGAHAIGFVFAESRRNIDVESAANISAQLPKDVIKIGVFVNATKQELIEISKRVQLDYVQLHGDETARFCKQLGIPYVKAFSVKEKYDLLLVKDYEEEMVLVDSGKGPYRGGNGTVFDWNYLESIDLKGKKLILAGGLNSENVREAVMKVRPYMVDVSSGVETERIKDQKKIKEFVRIVQMADEEYENLSL